MATSYRIKVIKNNKSSYVTPDTPQGMGATVIPASRGPMKPVRINIGETERICQLFKADRYEVLEAIAYNTKYPLWISAPSSGGSTACLLLTDKGLIPSPLCIGDDENALDFSNLPLCFYVGKGDGKILEFSKNLPTQLFPSIQGDTNYIPQATIAVDERLYPVTLTYHTDTDFVGFDVQAKDVGQGTVKFNDDTILVEFTFSNDYVPKKNETILFHLTTDTELLDFETYAIIGMRFPCEDFLAASVYKADIQGQLTLNLCAVKKGNYYTQPGYPINFSLEKGATDSSGNLIYAKELFRDDDFIFVLPSPNKKLDLSSWQGKGISSSGEDKNKALINFEGGFRGLDCKGTLLTEGWEQFKDSKKYPADIYFDVTADDVIPQEFSALRAVIPYRRFLYPYPMNVKPKDITSVPKVSDTGICAFWGAAYILNPYEKTGQLLSTLMGEVAQRYADARVFSYGGRAVAWGDENSVGGQLSQGRIIEFLYNATEDEMQRLDKLGINPIVLNELFGPMVASRRTTDQSMSDYSYADYSMIVDYCIEKIVNEVLPYQLIKFNDDEHRAVVRGKAENILKPLTQSPNNVIRDYAIKCDSENNGDDILTQQLFVLTVAIKVTPKSEYIQFTFINSAQGGSVQEDVK